MDLYKINEQQRVRDLHDRQVEKGEVSLTGEHKFGLKSDKKE